jgi:hypothetical protein
LISYLPLTLEWNAAAIFLLGGGFLSGDYLWAGLIPLVITAIWCMRSALKARIDPRYRGWRARSLVALLIYSGPVARSLERYRWRVRGVTEVDPIDFAEPTQSPEVSWRERAFQLAYWTDDGIEKEGLLQGLIDFLLPRKYFVAFDQGWSDWDLQVYRGIWAKAQIKVGTENHGGNKRLHRVRLALRMTRPAIIALCLYPLLALLGRVFGTPEVAAATAIVGALTAAAILYQGLRLGRVLFHVMEIVAKQLRLIALRPAPPAQST